ncbi:MAG: hypothetical protein HFI70_10715 [Lachnospiraceae bacterium]|nr:hypothetical protein [Lachnospiraceae bacterium]
MSRKKDEFADINGDKKRSGMVVFAVAVLAVCISGTLCARKLMMEQRYVSLNHNPVCQYELV